MLKSSIMQNFTDKGKSAMSELENSSNAVDSEVHQHTKESDGVDGAEQGGDIAEDGKEEIEDIDLMESNDNSDTAEANASDGEG
jgi:hypothetical protein